MRGCHPNKVSWGRNYLFIHLSVAPHDDGSSPLKSPGPRCSKVLALRGNKGQALRPLLLSPSPCRLCPAVSSSLGCPPPYLLYLALCLGDGLSLNPHLSTACCHAMSSLVIAPLPALLRCQPFPQAMSRDPSPFLPSCPICDKCCPSTDISVRIAPPPLPSSPVTVPPSTYPVPSPPQTLTTPLGWDYCAHFTEKVTTGSDIDHGTAPA